MFKFSIFLCCFCLSFNLLAQELEQKGIQTQSSLEVEDLVKNVFIKGNCRNVSNITAIGNESISIGQFENGEDNINIRDGIILSTGDITLAHGPNDSREASFSFNDGSIDSDLGQLATDKLFDVTGIEFDFVPLGDQVTFRYVFASEEYCEFVGSAFNDVFGFFVSGPGINGPFENKAINVAALSSTNEDVSINNVNHIDNVSFYVNNVTDEDAEACGIDFSPTYKDLIQYDGFTIPLVASFQVIPCQTYHIRLMLGDVGDNNLDSAVFLEAKSFDLGEKAIIRAEVPGSSESTAYENCVDGQFVFTRSSLIDINEDCTVEYSISPESEAINGVDFVEIPLSITIPAGDTSFILPITVIEDDVMEGPENIKLGFEYDCDCIDPVLSELTISETNNLSVSFEEIVACPDQAFSIAPRIIGGASPFEFLWETGATTETLDGSVKASTQYALTVTDFCGSSGLAVANIGIQNIPTATLSGAYDLCDVASTGIPVLLEGNPPWEIGYSVDGVEQVPIENIQTKPFYLNTPTKGTYLLTAFNDAYCEGELMGSAVVEHSTFVVAADIVSPTCFNSFDGSITITQLEAISPFTIEWNIETGDDYFIENLKEDTYILSIIDGNGCLYEEAFALTASSTDVNECAPFYIPNAFSPNNDEVNDVFSIFFSAASGIKNIISLQVYDRWGALLFEQTNFIPDNGATGWNGDFKGKTLNAGVYLYKVILAFDDGSTQLVSGEVMLSR